MLNLTKRQKFFIATCLVAGFFILSRLDIWPDILRWRFRSALFGIFTLLTTIWALKDQDFSGVEWITLPVLPVAFIVSAGLVYPLIPSEVTQIFFWLVDTDTGLFLSAVLKIIFLLFVVMGYYAALLASNIFNIAAIKTIQLLRAAHSTAFFVSLITVFFVHLVLLSFHFSFWINGLFIFLVILPLALHVVWSVDLGEKVSREVWIFSVVIALVLAQLGTVLSFWPVSTFVFALFQTVTFYELVGVVHYRIIDRLHKTLINELVMVGIVVLLLTIATTSWSN